MFSRYDIMAVGDTVLELHYIVSPVGREGEGYQLELRFLPAGMYGTPSGSPCLDLTL